MISLNPKDPLTDIEDKRNLKNSKEITTKKEETITMAALAMRTAQSTLDLNVNTLDRTGSRWLVKMKTHGLLRIDLIIDQTTKTDARGQSTKGTDTR